MNYGSFLSDGIAQMGIYIVLLTAAAIGIPYLVAKLLSMMKARKGLTGRILWFIVLMVLFVFAILLFYFAGWKLIKSLFEDAFS